METYRLSASALLRLAAIAATAPDADAAEILGIVQAAQAEPASLPHVGDEPDVTGDAADKPARAVAGHVGSKASYLAAAT